MESEANLVENKYTDVLERFYVNCKNRIWETDVFERYGSQTFIGIYPYCTAGNVGIIHNKIRDNFNEAVKDDKSLSDLNISMATITYPLEELTEKELLLTLGMRMNQSIVDGATHGAAAKCGF